MKRLLFILLLGYIVPNSFGQLYIQPSVGYTFSSHPIENQSVLIVDNQKTVYKTELKFGEGIHLGLDLGFSCKDNFFVELNVKQSIFSNYNTSTEQPDLQSLNNFSSSGYFGEINYENSIFQIAPLIGFQAKKNKFSSYFKVGPNLMKSTISLTLKYIDWELVNWDFYPHNTVKKYELQGKFHLGWQSNLGFCYALKQNMHIVIDFVSVYNNYEITNSEITFFEIDGVSHLDEIDRSNIPDNNNLNHSYYGINIGIKYVFNSNNYRKHNI